MASKSNKTQDQPERARVSFLQSPKRFQAFLVTAQKRLPTKGYETKTTLFNDKPFAHVNAKKH